ncbi:MAG: DNA repair protein RecO [Rickettsiales bacterium]|jgi:DNA repair protein RecO (recombination protein O)|nr:DNA repair protein RecO [Rickettsiales bacterium]
MHWSDSAIILAVRRHGETSAILRVFARDHGVVAGVVKGAFSKTNWGIIQQGNLVSASWSARLSEHIGMFKLEPQRSHAALIMQDEEKLAMLTSACALLEQALPERHPYPRLYDHFLHLLEDFSWHGYIHFEMLILAETGYGLDLTCCAATGQTHDLIYVSPKSGRAVSREAGEPYKDRLLRLPRFLSPRESGESAVRLDAHLHGDVNNGLTLTAYFLEHWLLEPHGKKMPPARQRLKQILYKAAESL